MQILPPEACSFHKEKWHILNNIVENSECEIDFKTNFRNKRSFLKKKKKKTSLFWLLKSVGDFLHFLTPLEKVIRPLLPCAKTKKHG